MLRMEFTQKDKEHNMYHWHPLFEKVESIENAFAIAVYRVYKSGGIDEYQKEMYLSNFTNFKNQLEFLWNCYNGVYDTIYKNHEPLKNLLDVFTPLDITCYKNLALFKYKSFIALDEMEMFGYDFWNKYDGLYRECRSVVIDTHNLSIVLAPQKKFFNVNENPEMDVKVIKDKIKDAKKVEITNKLDGSNQNYRWYNGEVVGSGSSALNPAESWRLTEGYKLLNINYVQMLKENPDYTFMFEYISPKNPIVVEYKKEQEGLYLFGARNVFTGKEMTYEEALSIGHKYGVKCTDIYDDSFEDILGKLDDYKSNEKEGWVIGIKNNNGDIFKAKLKVNDYVLMHKAITKMVSPNAIIKAIADGKYDDFYAKIPNAYRSIADDIAKTVHKYLYSMELNISAYYDEAKNNTDNKKDFMLYCNNNIPKKYKGYVICRYLNRKYDLIKIGPIDKNPGYRKLNEMIKLTEN